MNSTSLTYNEVVKTFYDETAIQAYRDEIVTLITTYTSLPPEVPDLDRAMILGHIVNVVFNLGVDSAVRPVWEKKFKALNRIKAKVWPNAED